MIKPVFFLFIFLSNLCFPFRLDCIFTPCSLKSASNKAFASSSALDDYKPVYNLLLKKNLASTKSSDAGQSLSRSYLESRNVILSDSAKKPSSAYWKIVWEDNFDDSIINTEKWNIVDWAAEKNNELQYYTPNNISLSNSNLCIISKKMDYEGRMYTSGAVETKDNFYFLYGKVEIRATLPSGKGIFPAFWMLPQDGNSLPEIDIMEMIGDEPSEIWMVYHWLENGLYQKSYAFHNGPNYSADYHTFSVEWSPDKIVWLIDDFERFSTHSSPDKPMFLYMNTAIGGDWPGAPDETTFSPQSLLVDYVRIYQKREIY